MSSSCLHSSKFLSQNASLLNTDQQSSSDNSFISIMLTLSIICATLLLRVVTKILLPEAPFCSASLNGSHDSKSSVHTSSKTRKIFLPSINPRIFSNRLCNSEISESPPPNP
ncbi:hypothetical protein ACB094_03G004300 [Castanea mollissima]